MIISKSHLRSTIRRVLVEERLVEYAFMGSNMSDSQKKAVARFDSAMLNAQSGKRKTALDKAKEKTGHMSAYSAAAAAKKPEKKEAAQTIGLNYFQTMRYVILPQALRRILPPLANQFIYIVKMSAFASVIGMQELTRRANEIVVTEYRPLEVYTLLIFEYLILVLIISFAVRWLERRMGSNESLNN